MNSNKIAARSFGIAFLIGYISYGLGFGLLNSVINSPGGLATIYANKNQVIFEAAIMMAVFATINIGLGIIMTPVLKPYNKTLTYGYLSAAIASTVMLIVGAIFLLLLVPLSEEFVTAGAGDTTYFQTLGILCKKANFFSYQIGMVIWGLGGLLFCYLLYLSKLVPRWMSVWGFIGYIIFISGAFFALFGISIDVILDIPGGLFEIFLSFWLIFKGFNGKAAELSK
ncbi:MAG: DUF4386 domain-containing protein [Prolixibacteraceae bacterium]|nr:DUF4386 domain-containing protein [Prolixibacteraceae bacterium]